MKRIIAFICLVIFLLWYNYPEPVFYSPPMSNESIHIDSVLSKIENDIVDLTSTSDLVTNKYFIKLCSFAGLNFTQFFNYLESADVSEQRKIILIMAAHSLPKDKFVEFFKYGCDLYVQKKLNENELLYLLVPGNNWNNRSFIYFYKQEIRYALKKIRNSERSNHEIKTIVKDILSGKMTLMLYFE